MCQPNCEVNIALIWNEMQKSDARKERFMCSKSPRVSYPTAFRLFKYDMTSEGFPGSSVVKKNLPAMQEMPEMWIQSLSQEDPLEECMATHSSILAWRILWTEEPGGLQSMWLQRVRHDWSDWTCTHTCMTSQCHDKHSNYVNNNSIKLCHRHYYCSYAQAEDSETQRR